MLEAVIFDFDGVITDSEILHFRAFNVVLAPHGLELTKKEYYTKYLGLSDVDCLRALIDEGRLGIEKDQIQDLISKKTRIYEKLAQTDGQLIEGVSEFLDMLRTAQIPIAICSGSLRAEIEFVLRDAGLRDLFDVIVSAEDVSRGKPDPEGFLLALQQLNESTVAPITPGKCIVIEDSHWGLEAARGAQMRTIAVTNTYDAGQLSAAHLVVERLSDLTIDDLGKLCS